MSRKPAPLELRGGKGNRQRVWEAIRTYFAVFPDGVFTVVDISRAAKVETGIVTEYVKGLRAAGYIGMTRAPARGVAGLYHLARDAGLEAPRVRRDGTPVTQGLAQEQMWRTLRMVKGSTNARELAAHASTPAVPVAESAAADYLRNLHNAGYLRRDDGRQARYTLMPPRNTGPRPPMVCRIGVVFDPNEARVVWQPESVTEEDCIYGS